MINNNQPKALFDKFRRATHIGALSITMMTAASIIPMAHADETNGHIGNDSIPGNSGAALTGSQTECMGQILSTLASTSKGLRHVSPPTSVIDTVDYLFYVGDLLPDGWDCSIYAS